MSESRSPSGWTIDEIVAATGAQVRQRGAADAFTAIATNSRELPTGALFVALRGEHHDGHAFVADAAAAGARGVLVDRDVTVARDVAVLAVPDTLRGLQDIAASLRHRRALRVVAITGSNGKTTTKEMLAAILEAASAPADVLKTQGNLNNLIGVPLTLLRLSGAERYAVIEMGMNAPGEIARLTEIADPDVGVITNVAAAHLEGLGTLDGVARAKGELYEHMRPDGVAIANADDARVAALAARFPGPVVRFGAGTEVDAAHVECDAAGAAAFELRVEGRGTRVRLAIPGRHNVVNALAAAAAAHALGVDLDAVRRGLEVVAPIGNRMRRITLPNGVTIVNDSYNANPASVAAGLRSLRDAAAARRIAVLGDMLELGAASAALHREVGRLAGELGIDALYVCGDFAGDTAAGAREAMPAAAVHVEDSHQAIAARLGDAMRVGDCVLVKGSRGQRMEEVVRLLGVTD